MKNIITIGILVQNVSMVNREYGLRICILHVTFVCIICHTKNTKDSDNATADIVQPVRVIILNRSHVPSSVAAIRSKPSTIR